MGSIFRIGIALVIGAFTVGGAFVWKQAEPTAATAVAEVVTGTYERAYHETKDTDGDGMRDWEEELRGRDPLTPDADATSTDRAESKDTEPAPYTPPDTATGQFAQSFFDQYFRASAGRTLSEEEAGQLLNSSVASLVREVNTQPLTRVHLSVGSENSLDAVRTYGNNVGRIFVERLDLSVSPPVVLGAALEAQRPESLAQLGAVADMYAGITEALQNTSVPPRAVQEHLALVNVTHALAHDVRGMQLAFDDPLNALVNTQEYQSDLESLSAALEQIRRILESEGIVYTAEEWGMFLFSLRP